MDLGVGKILDMDASAGPADGATVELGQQGELASAGIVTSAARGYRNPRTDGRQHRTAEVGSSRQITVFLMPGVHYHDLASYKTGRSSDILGLARFRHSLSDRIRFVLIRYPNWREMIAAKGDFTAIVTSALGQILGECGDDPIYLAGHSFGGLVALDAAHRLVQSGRQVVFLGLFDTWGCDAASLRVAASKVHDFLRGKDVYALLRLMLRMLIAVGAFTALRQVAIFCMRIGGLPVGIQITSVLRCYSLRNWQAKAISVPTCLFRCEEHQTDGPYDYGWSSLCSRFRVISVGGDHDSIFSPRHVRRLAGEFAEALQEAAMSN
jgi:thioesterase domain-containing protein